MQEHSKIPASRNVTRRKFIKYGIVGLITIGVLYLVEPVQVGSNSRVVRGLSAVVRMFQKDPPGFTELQYPGQNRVMLPMFSPEGDRFAYVTCGDYEEYRNRRDDKVGIQHFGNNIRVSAIEPCLIQWINNDNLAILYIEDNLSEDIGKGLSLEKVVNGVPVAKVYNALTEEILATRDVHSIFPFIEPNETWDFLMSRSAWRIILSISDQNGNLKRDYDFNQGFFCYILEGRVHQGVMPMFGYGIPSVESFNPITDIGKLLGIEQGSRDVNYFPDTLKFYYGKEGRIYEVLKVGGEIITNAVTPIDYDFSMPAINQNGILRAVYSRKIPLSNKLEKCLMEAQ